MASIDIPLKTVRAFDFVTLRIPEHWASGRDPDVEGYWTAGNAVGEDGTKISITWDEYRHPKGFDPAAHGYKFTTEICDSIKDTGEIDGEIEVTPVDGGYVCVYQRPAVEDGELLRFWWYHFLHFTGGTVVMTLVNFVIPDNKLAKPGIRELQNILDSEIRATTFERPLGGHPDERFGELMRFNLGDLVKIHLPETVIPDGYAEGAWCFTFDPLDIPARLFVVTEDKYVLDDDGAPVAAPEGSLREMLTPWFTSPSDDRTSSFVPGGFLSHETLDGRPDEGSPVYIPDVGQWSNGPTITHWWMYCCCTLGKLRATTFVLVLPRAEHREPPLSKLIEFVGYQVRRARFPGVTVDVA